MMAANKSQKPWLRPVAGFWLSFFFLVLTAALGTFLRYMFVGGAGWANYKNFLHAHSHLAFLGWVYNALYAFIVYYFIPREKQKGLMQLFWLTQLATVGMLIAFPIQGYARESIIFSSLHIFFSWAFALMVWRRLQSSSPVARLYLKLALFFMLISSLGPFAMGPLMAKGLGGSSWYYGAIYFYLHFQYNGWFIFALLALLYQYLAQQGQAVEKAAAHRAFYLFSWGCLFSLSLSVLWAYQQGWLFLLAAGAGVMQLAGCYYLYHSLSPLYPHSWQGLQPLVKQLLLFAGGAFLLKNVLQLLGGFPALSNYSFGIRNFIIAFLHLVFLGVVTPGLLALAFRKSWLPATLFTRCFTYLFLLTFVLSQLLLVLVYVPGLGLWFAPLSPRGMFLLSAAMFLALAGIGLACFGPHSNFYNQRLKKTNHSKLA